MTHTHADTDGSLGVATAAAAVCLTMLLAAAVWMGASVVTLVGGEFAAGLRTLSTAGL